MTLKMRSKVKFNVTRMFAIYHFLYVHNWFLSCKVNNKRDISRFVQWPWKWGQRSNSRSPLESPYMTSYLNVLLSKLYLEVFWVFSDTHPRYEAKSHCNFLSPKKNFHMGQKKIFFFGWKWLKTHSKSILDNFFFFRWPVRKTKWPPHEDDRFQTHETYTHHRYTNSACMCKERKSYQTVF